MIGRKCSRRRMGAPNCFRTMYIVLVVVLSVAPGVKAAEAADEPAWRDLFDGKTLTGWSQLNGKANYRVEDGAIVGSSVNHGGNSFLCTRETFGDFILELDFKVDPKLNSGVQIRSESREDVQNGRVHGYQVEIDPSDRAWTGGIYDESRRGWLYDLDGKPEARKAFKQGEWNHFRIEAIGDKIKTWVNGAPVADLTDSMTARGFIGLQVHGTQQDEPMEIRWRKIRIQDLSKAER